MIFKKPSKSASDEEKKADIFKKATENWNAENEIPTLQADETVQKKVVSSLNKLKNTIYGMFCWSSLHAVRRGFCLNLLQTK